MIKVNNITKYFGTHLAVKDLSFEIKKGEILGFLGPNGAGKTTTMRIMTGYLYPDSGDVTIDDISVKDNSLAVKKKVGYLPENNPLYADMLVADFLKYSLELKKIKSTLRKKALDFAIYGTDISDVYYKPINQLSKGYKQRVGLAATLLHQPEVLILDEPTEGLDPNQRNQIRKLIKKLSKKHTIIMSTHVMQEVTATCNRILIINHGKKVADDKKKTLVENIQGGKKIEVELEGDKIKSEIKKVKDVNVEDIEEIRKKHYLITLTSKKANIERKIARLAQKKDWIVLGLKTQEQDLEDIFRQLTEKK